MTKDDVFFSDRFKELLGLEPEEMADRYEAWEVLLHPADREPTLAAIRAHLEDDAAYDVEYRLACADGSYRWFRARGRAVRDAGGKPVRMAGSISDIEAYKQAVGALVQSNSDLEQFAYVASHDLKEPLRMVASYVQLLERRYADQLDDTAREFIGFATEGAKRMRHLIDDLLVYARIGTRGKRLEPIAAEKALAAAVADLKLAAGESGIEITHGALPVVMGDGTQLIQLFENLLSNAIKFRSADRAALVHVSAEQEKGAEWLFKVADNGIGIGAEYQQRIFEIFQRLHSREDFPGTGIGLAVCAKIVARHGGRLWVESVPGEGATFSFTLKAVADLGAEI